MRIRLYEVEDWPSRNPDAAQTQVASQNYVYPYLCEPMVTSMYLVNK